MPYLPKELRDVLDEGEAIHPPMSPGELNYQFSKLIKRYIAMKNGLRYQVANDIIGALECQKLEVYRRLVAPYEDQKIRENQDVY